MPEDIQLPALEGASPETQDEAPSLSEREAKKLKMRLRISERYREKEFKTHYETSLRLYKGKHWPERTDGTTGDESRVVVNMVYPMVQTKVSTIGFRYPEFTLTPLNLQSQEKARLATAAMRYEWKISKTQREVCRALHDKEIFGIGIVQTGWEYRTRQGINRTDGREEGGGEADTLDFEAMARAVSEKGAPSEETPEEDVIADQFYCKRISPWNFLVDPEGDWVLDDHEYVAICEMVPLSQIRRDPRLKNNRDLKGTSRGHNSFLDQDAGKDESKHPTDIKRVKVYHYYEKERQLYAMFTDEHDKPLLVEKWAWEHGRYPFRVIHSPKLQDCWYDQTPVELIQSQQEEINVTRTMLRNHMRRFTRKFSCARGMLDRNAKQQLKSAIDGGIVEHNGGPEMKVIQPIDHAPIPAEVYKSDEWAIRDIRYSTGLDEYDLSSVGKTRRTAQEVAQIRQAGGSRAQADAQMFEMFCAEVGEDLLDLMMQFSTKIQTIPVFGPNDNIAEWSDFSSEDIKGEYLVDVYVGSTQPKNRIELQQQYISLLQILGPILPQPNPATGLPYGNVQALVRSFLEQFPDIRNIDEILTPEQPPAPPMMPGMEGMVPQGPQPQGPPQQGPMPPQGGPPV